MHTQSTGLTAYSIYGTTLLSDVVLSLPLAEKIDPIAIHLESGAPQDFAHARTHIQTDSSVDWVHHAVLADGSVFIRWEAWLEFIVSPDGKTVRYLRLNDDMIDAFEAYIANFAVSAALVQIGEEPLHSTVIEMAGRSIGLLGPSGAGKSTLAAYLLGNGGRLITDDMLRITILDGQAFAERGPLRLKLLQDAATRYLQTAGCRGRWNPFAQKYLFVPGDESECTAASPIDALFWLEAPPTDAVSEGATTTRLRGLELFKVIAASTMNSRLNTPNRLQRQLEATDRIGNLLPTYRLTYPRRHEIFPDVLRAIRQAIS